MVRKMTRKNYIQFASILRDARQVYQDDVVVIDYIESRMMKYFKEDNRLFDKFMFEVATRVG